jgi:hypothetical protein
MVRRWQTPFAIPPGYQVHGESIWRSGRELFWSGNLGGGLYLPQGFAAAVDLGLLPPDARLVKVGKGWDAVNAALARSPLVQAHYTHPGWFQADTVSGCIDHEPAPDRSAAHATLLVATLERPDVSGAPTRWRVLLNSWGAQRGRFGLFTMTEAEWAEGVMADGLYTAEIPDLAAWDGWKKGLVRTP